MEQRTGTFFFVMEIRASVGRKPHKTIQFIACGSRQSFFRFLHAIQEYTALRAFYA
jgi:hypothetical protein